MSQLRTKPPVETHEIRFDFTLYTKVSVHEVMRGLKLETSSIQTLGW